jgi:hypothetical protein
MEQPDPILHRHILSAIFKKLADTFEKYRDVSPEIKKIEEAISYSTTGDFVVFAIITLDRLKSLSQHSALAAEILDNMTMDYLHGVDETNPGHKGKYYINSVAGND